MELLHSDELARALTEWKILQTLDPENAEYRRQIAATQALIRHRVAQRLEAADAAFSAGEYERAQTEYLRALALDPARTEPLHNLREIDRKRALAEQAARLLKSNSRRTAGQAQKGGGARPEARAPGQQERDYLDTGIALLGQGKYEESVLEIEKYLQSYPDDPEARQYLTDALGKLVRGSSPPEPAIDPIAKPPTPEASPKAPPPEGEPKAGHRQGGTANGMTRAGTPSEGDRALAQEFYEKGLRAYRTDIAQAIEYWEKSLTFDPDHVQAKLQLEKARRMQRNLERIPGE